MITFNGADDGVVEEELGREGARVMEYTALDGLDIGGFFAVILGVLESKWVKVGEHVVVEVFFGDIRNHKEILSHIIFD